jgi:hypothetical protein
MATGGGYLILTTPGGLKAGDVGSKNNFGFNIKSDKNGPKGDINIIVRRTEADGKLHVYQIDGIGMRSLSTKPFVSFNTPGTATFYGYATIADITNPQKEISVDAYASLQFIVTDRGEPGVNDSIAITLWDSSGGLWFASNWNGTRTVEQILSGGNIQVR